MWNFWIVMIVFAWGCSGSSQDTCASPRDALAGLGMDTCPSPGGAGQAPMAAPIQSPQSEEAELG